MVQGTWTGEGQGRRRGEAGQDLVEFALVLPLLVLLFFGIIEFGRVIFTYNTLANAAREGARFGIVVPNSNGDGFCPSTAVRPPTTILEAACGLTSGLVPGDITVVTSRIGNERLTVQVSYPFRWIVGPIVAAAGAPNPMTLTARSSMQREQ